MSSIVLKFRKSDLPDCLQAEFSALVEDESNVRFDYLQSKLLASVDNEEFSSWFTILYHQFYLPEKCDAEVFPNKLKYGNTFICCNL